MISFLAIQATYQNVNIGLFNDSTMLQHVTIPNIYASKQLILVIDGLLKTSNTQLKDLSCIMASQGPAPFSTLRTVLTAANAIQFACALPLIGVDGLRAIAQEYHNPNYPHTITLLDAFNNDVYFCIPDSISNNNGDNNDLQNLYDICYYTGYCNINTFIAQVATLQQTKKDRLFPIRFVGSGSLLHKHAIEAHIPTSYVQDSTHSACSLSYIGLMGLKTWKKNISTSQLLPLYLKKHQAER